MLRDLKLHCHFDWSLFCMLLCLLICQHTPTDGVLICLHTGAHTDENDKTGLCKLFVLCQFSPRVKSNNCLFNDI